MRVTHLVGIAAAAGGGIWFYRRLAVRKGLKDMLEQSPKLQAIQVLNQAYLQIGNTTYANYTPEKLATHAIKLTNSVTAQDAYNSIIASLPSPEELEDKGILGREEQEALDAVLEAAGTSSDEIFEYVGESTGAKEAGEGAIPDWVPVIGTREKVSYWQSWFGDGYGVPPPFVPGESGGTMYSPGAQSTTTPLTCAELWAYWYERYPDYTSPPHAEGEWIPGSEVTHPDGRTGGMLPMPMPGPQYPDCYPEGETAGSTIGSKPKGKPKKKKKRKKKKAKPNSSYGLCTWSSR